VRVPQLTQERLRAPALEDLRFFGARQQPMITRGISQPRSTTGRTRAKRSKSPWGGSGAMDGRSRRHARHAVQKYSDMPSQRTPSKSSARIVGVLAGTTEL